MNPATTSSGSKRWRLASVALVILAVAVTGWLLMRRGAGAVEYTTRPVERGEVRSVVNATGTVQALLTVQVGSQVSGQVQALHADYNSVVRRGQLLAKLDPRNYQAALDGARANLLSAQARVAAAEAEVNSQAASRQSAAANAETARVTRDNAARILARYEELRRQGILSENDFESAQANAETTAARHEQALAQSQQVEAQIHSAQAQLEQAKAQVAQAEAAVQQARVNLEYTDIYSPVDGVVVSRSVDVGQTVAASLAAPTLFVIANDLARMQVHASVDEADIGSVSETADVRFTVDAYPNRFFTGSIGEIRLEPQTLQNVVTYSVIIDVDNQRLELKPGMTANLSITVAERSGVLRVPNAALRYLPPGTTREQMTEMLRQAPAGALQTSGPASVGEPGMQAGSGGRDGFRRERMMRAAESTEAGRSAEMERAAADLAPGQMWNPAEKIEFPRQAQPMTRPAIVWVQGAQRNPEPRRAVLGISDGTVTEVVSGELREGDAVVVGDSSQAAPSQQNQQFGPGSGTGGSGRFIFGGPPR